MATFVGVTTSSGAKIKEEKIQELRTYLSMFNTAGEDGEMVHLEETSFTIDIYGYGWLYVSRYIEGSVPEANDFEAEEYSLEEFLRGLAEFLKEPLIVQCIGNENCRFPLAAWECKIHPDGKLEHNSFQFA